MLLGILCRVNIDFPYQHSPPRPSYRTYSGIGCLLWPGRVSICFNGRSKSICAYRTRSLAVGFRYYYDISYGSGVLCCGCFAVIIVGFSCYNINVPVRYVVWFTPGGCTFSICLVLFRLPQTSYCIIHVSVRNDNINNLLIPKKPGVNQMPTGNYNRILVLRHTERALSAAKPLHFVF